MKAYCRCCSKSRYFRYYIYLADGLVLLLLAQPPVLVLVVYARHLDQSEAGMRSRDQSPPITAHLGPRVGLPALRLRHLEGGLGVQAAVPAVPVKLVPARRAHS